MQDAATGLTYMQQRYYDPTMGRFLSVDPVTALSSPVGMFNRYKYAANNPYRFVDPDGRQEKTKPEREEKVTGSNIPGNSVAKAMIATTASEDGGRWSGGGGASGGRGASGSWGNGGATGDWGPKLPTDEEERIEPIFPEAELPLLKGLKFATLGLFAIRMGARAELEVSAHALRRLSAEEGKVVANEIARHISLNGAPAAGATIQQTIVVGGREYSFRAFGMTNGSTRLSTVVEGRFGRDVAAPKP